MKRTYAFVANERPDETIRNAVAELFASRQYRKVPLSEFQGSLCAKLRLQGNPVSVIDLEDTAQAEQLFRAKAYRVIDNVVYQEDPDVMQSKLH